MYKDMAFCHLQENLKINMIKKLMNTSTKTGINAAKRFGDKYVKNLTDTSKKNKELILLRQLVKNSLKKCRSNRRFDWK